MGWWWASREQVAKAKVNEVRPRKLVATPCTLCTNSNEALCTPAQERWHPPSVIAPDRRASQDQPGPINASCILSGPKFQLHLDFATPTTTTTTATLLLPIGTPPNTAQPSTDTRPAPRCYRERQHRQQSPPPRLCLGRWHRQQQQQQEWRPAHTTTPHEASRLSKMATP